MVRVQAAGAGTLKVRVEMGSLSRGVSSQPKPKGQPVSKHLLDWSNFPSSPRFLLGVKRRRVGMTALPVFLTALPRSDNGAGQTKQTLAPHSLSPPATDICPLAYSSVGLLIKEAPGHRA